MRTRFLATVLVLMGLSGAVCYILIALKSPKPAERGVSEPKEGTVEWHKREILRILKKPDGSLMITQEEAERVAEHQRQLVKLGYLQEREFVITNRPMKEVMRTSGEIMAEAERSRPIQREFTDTAMRGTNGLFVRALPEDMALISNAIRKADAPHTAQ
jgi:hypothetical protein